MTTARRLDFPRELNTQQLAAVTHGDAPQLVLAGAGSGKTRVITYRIAWLVRERGVEPTHIAAVTFTNKAASEMKERVEDLLERVPLPTFVGTFHRFALRLLRAHGDRVGLARDFSIFDTDDQLSVVKKALELEKLAETSFPPRAVLSAISRAKHSLQTPAEYAREADDFFRSRVAGVYRRYQELLQQAGGIDFDDMIQLAVELLRQHAGLRERIRRGVEHLLVDEFQDTNHAQLSLVRELVGEGGRLTAVGDEDQGIYRWRGAELGNILDFEASFPGARIRKLERNYRSTQTILDAAGAVVANNRRRRGKRLWTETVGGDPIVLFQADDEQDEARWVAERIDELRTEVDLSAIGALVRTHAQTRALEDELLRREIPYTLVGGVRFYERAEIKDLVAYLRLVRNPDDALSFNRIVNRPPRGIGRTTHEQLLEQAAGRGVTPWRILQDDRLEGFTARAVRALRSFGATISALAEDAAELPVPELLRRVLEATGYAELYRGKGDPESAAKLENIGEFLSAAQAFVDNRRSDGAPEDLTAFLDHASLTSDLDQLAGRGGVSLMTLHSAKGLEFRAVFLTGLEDDLLPHFNSKASDDDLEEERRLLYVGMTRAERRLFLSYCLRRRVSGRYQDRRPSPFLDEVPGEHLTVVESSRLRPPEEAASVYAFFGQEASPPRAGESGEPPGPGAPRRLRRGARVRHAKLGRGVVLSMEGSGDDLRLTVYFDALGKRKLVARYANLEVV